MPEKKIEKNSEGKFVTNIGNNLIVAFLKAISFLPFPCIYALSNSLYFLNKRLLKYRYKVASENLKATFPEKNETDIAQIRDKFYRHFFDLMLESIKLYSMNEQQIKERISFKGFAECERITGERNGSIILAFHYGNWEWCTYLQTQLKYPVLMVYNPPRDNKPMEKFLKKSRGKWGGEVIRTNSAARTAIKHKQNNKPAILWLAADQTALASSPFWIAFLNREAAFFAGPELLAKRTNHPIFFQHVKKVNRGKYEVELSLLVSEPAKLDPSELLRCYVQKMEEVIKFEPEYYLWTHKRWKHTRPEQTPLIK